MKKQIKLIAALLLLGAATTFANQMPTTVNRLLVSIEKSTDAQTCLDLRLANLEKQGTTISLQDLSGNQWFSQFVWRQVGYAKRLNLQGMPDGVYTLSVKHRDATVIQVLRLSKGNLELSKQKQVEMPAEAGNEQVSR
jgi:hypothetical protein